jgi:hypothetical protein
VSNIDVPVLILGIDSTVPGTLRRPRTKKAKGKTEAIIDGKEASRTTFEV